MAEGAQIGEAFVRIRPDASKFSQELNTEVTKAGKSASDTLKDVLTVGAFTLAAKSIISSASDLQQAVGGTTAVFGESQAAVAEWAKGADEAAGLSERAARQLTSQIGGLLKGFGFAKDEAAATSIELAQLGADLAATFGGTTQEAVEALAAALRGETDPLERFGISLNQAAINAKAMELGLADSATEVTGNAKAQAALALITERSADAQGQFGREADTAAGQLERSKAKIENTAASIGSDLLPVVAQAADLVGFLTDGFSALPQPVQTSALALAGVALVGPKVVQGLSGIRDLAGAARDGLDTLALKAMYARDGMSAAASGASAAASSLGALGTGGILAAVTVPLAALTIAWQNHNAEQAANRASEKQLTELLKEQRDALKETTDAWLRKQFAEGQRDNIGKTLVGTTADLEVLTKGIRENGTNLDYWRNRIMEYGETWGDIRPKLEDAAAGGDAMSAELLRLVDSGEITSDQAKQLILDFDFLNDRVDNAATKAGIYEQVMSGVADTTGDVSDETKKAEEASKRYTDALKAQQDAALDLVGGELAVRDAERDTRQAMQDLVDLRKDGTATADDLAAAQDRVAESMLRQAQLAAENAQKQAEANGQSLTAAERAEIQKQKLIELADTLAPGSALREQLQGFIDQLELVKSPPPIVIQIDTSTAEGKLDAFRQRLKNPDYTYQLDANGNVILAPPAIPDLSFLNEQGQPKAAGGRVSAGTTYPVNEYGIEGLRTVGGTTYLTPGADGTVIPANQMGSPSGGFTINGGVTIVSSDPEKAGRAFLRSVRREAAFAGGR